MKEGTGAILPTVKCQPGDTLCTAAWHVQLLQVAGTQACVVMHNTKNGGTTGAQSTHKGRPAITTGVTTAHKGGRAVLQEYTHFSRVAGASESLCRVCA
jgi:hypothetical protein